MQQVVTLVSYEVKTGQGQKGPWTLKTYKDAGGNKFQTFDAALQNVADGLIGQAATVTFEVEPRQYTDSQGTPRTANNNVLKSIEAAGQQQAFTPNQVSGSSTLPLAPATVVAPAAQVIDQRQTLINRSAALARAIEAHAAGIAKVTDPQQLAAIADLFVKYIETGSFA